MKGIVGVILICLFLSNCSIRHSFPAKNKHETKQGFLVFQRCSNQMPCEFDHWYFVPAKIKTIPDSNVVQQFQKSHLEEGFFIYRGKIDSSLLQKAYRLSEKITTHRTDSITCNVAILPVQIGYEVVDYSLKQVQWNEIVYLADKKKGIRLDYDMHHRKIDVLLPL